jgi:anti-sigma-K factor RskA
VCAWVFKSIENILPKVDIKEIIESGTLELYVMGALPPDEAREIDLLRPDHPELNSEIKRIEDAMLAYADSHSVKPARELKEKIARQLEFSVSLDMETEMVDSILIQMPGIYKLAAAAAVALIVALAGTTVYFGYNYRGAQNEIMALRAEKSQLAAAVKIVSTEKEKISNELAVASQPENKKILLSGLPIAPHAQAVVYWNKTTGATYLNARALPGASTDKQFQLWAIVKGKPFNLGVIDADTGFSIMKQVENATAFAITLEPKGGSASPTLNQIYVMGNI